MFLDELFQDSGESIRWSLQKFVV